MREKVNAVILSTLNYKESDKIYILFTKEKGIISTIAKGVRKIISRRASSLDTLNVIKASLEYSNNYYFIEDVVLVESFNIVKKSILFSSFAYFILEATKNIIPEHTVSEKTYQNLIKTLIKLDSKPSKRDVYKYLKNLLIDSGFWDYDNAAFFPYLTYIDSEGSVLTSDQNLIDKFFILKIEEIGEKKLISQLILSKL